MRILLVEDDAMLGETLCRGLSGDGHAVDWLRDGRQVAEAVRTGEFEMLLLDLSLPGSDGLTILQSLRKEFLSTPIIIITARGDVRDRIKGLDLGADDYLSKPFSFAELDARMRAVERRTRSLSSTVVVVGELSCDTSTKWVEYRGAHVDLSSREYQLLVALLRRPGAILSKTQLTEKLYDWSTEIESNTIEVHIHRLRQKLSPQLIRTVRGLGYQLVLE